MFNISSAPTFRFHNDYFASVLCFFRKDREVQEAWHIYIAFWSCYSICRPFRLDISVDVDFVDLLLEDLKHQDPPLLHYQKPWITSQAEERIYLWSGDNFPTNRPSHRGPAPSKRDIEPSIMPSEHWLEVELPCPAPQAKLSNDMLVLGRLSKLPTLLSLWLEPVSRPDSEVQTLVASENGSLPKKYTSQTIANLKNPAILARSLARTCAGEICSSPEEADSVCAELFVLSRTQEATMYFKDVVDGSY